MSEKKSKYKIFSHSKLSSFEQCPQKYKYRYLDKIIPEIEGTIETHFGKVVHSTLEWLYTQVKEGKVPTIEETIAYYSKKWEEDYSDSIKIVNNSLTVKDHFNQGVKAIIEYYLKHKPFDDNTLELEKRILFNLDPEGKYKLIGYIDRLVHNLKTGQYEIHDYKTANSLPSQEKVDKDRQLALYAIAIKELFGQDKEVLLIWHYLTYNKKIISKRNDFELENLRKDILALIEIIENTKEFPPNPSILCNWCEYQDICPEFKRNKFP